MQNNIINENENVARLCNGYEAMCARDWCYVGMTESFNAFDINLFIENFFKVMKHTIIFNLIVKKINSRLYWVRKPLDFINLEVRSPEGHKSNGVPFTDIEFVSGDPLHKIIYSTDDKESKLTVLFSHCLFDGAGVLKFFPVIRKIVEITLEQSNVKESDTSESDFDIDHKLAPLINMINNRDHEFSMEFDVKKWMFTGITEEEYNGTPKSWASIGKIAINPILQRDGWITTNTITKSYSPMKKYCIKHSVTPQAILMAIRARSCRKFMNLDNSYALTATAPVATRFTKFATPIFKNSMFFSAASYMFTNILGKDSIDDEIQECYNKLKLINDDPTSCVILEKISRNIKEESLETSDNVANMPDGSKGSIISAVHLGRFESGIGHDTQISVCGKCCVDGQYAITLYGYHDDDTFIYTTITPSTIGREIVDSIFEQVSIMQEHLLADLSKQ